MDEPDHTNEAAPEVAVARTLDQRLVDAADGALPRTATRVEGRTSDAGMLLPVVGDTVGNYVLLKKLGEGAHGAVFSAHRVGLEEHKVALKIIPATAEEVPLVRQELVTLATVVHPNIVQLTDHGAEAGFAWFSMPLYQGAPLDAKLNERFRAGQTLGLEEAHEIFHPLAGALAALHAAGFRHQDVKPENVFLARFADKEHPILLDLGVAIAKDNQRFLAGTREYFAPEQLNAFLAALRIRPLEGPPALGEAMDVYSLAVTLVLALVGPALAPGASLLQPETMDKDLREVWPLIDAAQADREAEPIPRGALRHVSSGARDEIAHALQRWLARDPKTRPSAAVMAKELDVLLSQRKHVEARRRRNARIGIGAGALFLFGAPAAYAGGHYAVTLEECTQRVAADAQEKGAVSQNLTDCQAHEASLLSQGQSCQKSLDDANSSKAALEKDTEGKISSCTNADQNLKNLLAVCQGDRDTSLAKDKTCEATLSTEGDQLRVCGTARDSATAAAAACNGTLASCNQNLNACSASATKCASDLSRAETTASQCTGNLTQCSGSLSQSQAAANDANTRLGACNGDLSSCRSGASGSGQSLSSCQASLAGAQGQVASMQSELTACQASLRTCRPTGPRR